jgi:hypothetical protein
MKSDAMSVEAYLGLQDRRQGAAQEQAGVVLKPDRFRG